MQKKILSAVIALCLVGSTSVAFAGGYWSQPRVDVDIDDSFNRDSQNDNSKTVDIDKTLTITKDSNNDNSKTYTDNSDNSKRLYLDLEKNYNSKNTVQGNKVKGHIVVQQFGGASGGSGDVISIDHSINNSNVGSFNINDSFKVDNSFNKEYNSTKNYTSNYTSTKSYSNRTKTDIDVDVDIDDSFNRDSFNGMSKSKISLGGHLRR